MRNEEFHEYGNYNFFPSGRPHLANHPPLAKHPPPPPVHICPLFLILPPNVRTSFTDGP